MTAVRAWVQESPIGELLLASTDVGVAAVEWGPTEVARTRVSSLGAVTDDVDGDVADAIRAYFDGDLDAFAGLTIDWRLAESGFRREVLAALHRLEPGALTSYGQLAHDVGKPGAAQAVGQAVGSNPVPVIVPCHRVISADGSLGGFSGGLSVKRALLAHEGFADLPGGWRKAGQDPVEGQLALDLG